MIEERVSVFAPIEEIQSETASSMRPRSAWCRSRPGLRSTRSARHGLFRALALAAFLLPAFQVEVADAIVYNAPKIITISVRSNGEVYIRWDTVPDPGACGGENNHWVVIPAAASDTLKSMALSLYFSGKPARVDTAAVAGTPPAQQPAGACTGAYENVTFLYSPGG